MVLIDTFSITLVVDQVSFRDFLRLFPRPYTLHMSFTPSHLGHVEASRVSSEVTVPFHPHHGCTVTEGEEGEEERFDQGKAGEFW